jgi:hypothetical protein
MPCDIKSALYILKRAFFRSPSTAGVGSAVPMFLHNIPMRMELPMLRLWGSSLTPTSCQSVILVFSVSTPSSLVLFPQFANMLKVILWQRKAIKEKKPFGHHVLPLP